MFGVAVVENGFQWCFGHIEMWWRRKELIIMMSLSLGEASMLPIDRGSCHPFLSRRLIIVVLSRDGTAIECG